MDTDKKTLFLVVDDMSNMRRTIKNMLRYLGYPNIVEADNGEKAWSILQSDKIDCIICDLIMPVMNGMEVLRRVKENPQTKDIPFLMVTAEIAEEAIAEAAEFEVDGYIVKPFVAKTLEDKIIKALARKNASSPLDLHLNAGMKHLASGDHMKALAELDAARRIDPKNPRVYHAIGQVYSIRTRYAAAEKAFQKALAVAPQFIKAYTSLADMYQRLGQWSKAAAAIASAIHISPRNADRHMAYGQALLRDGRTEEAISALNEARKLDPLNPARQKEIGEAFLAAGMDDDATKAFQEVLNMAPQDINTYNLLGIVLRKQSRYHEAISAYQRAIEHAPDDENLHFNLGRAFLEANNKDLAIQEFEKALEISPNFEVAKRMLDKLLNSQ
ncbi:MAG: tetratricopeptide repeat protein [Deltaproteobacteria bacterium]|nr:tetratricopeptide repeat protein [Deltaproteobacteria bacterium]